MFSHDRQQCFGHISDPTLSCLTLIKCDYPSICSYKMIKNLSSFFIFPIVPKYRLWVKYKKYPFFEKYLCPFIPLHRWHIRLHIHTATGMFWVDIPIGQWKKSVLIIDPVAWCYCRCSGHKAGYGGYADDGRHSVSIRTLLTELFEFLDRQFFLNEVPPPPENIMRTSEAVFYGSITFSRNTAYL